MQVDIRPFFKLTKNLRCAWGVVDGGSNFAFANCLGVWESDSAFNW
jgi:hypothetical protein